MTHFTESVVEEAALAWLSGLGYTVLHGPEIAWGMPHAERGDPGYRDVVLGGRLRGALLPKLISGELKVADADRFISTQVT